MIKWSIQKKHGNNSTVVEITVLPLPKELAALRPNDFSACLGSPFGSPESEKGRTSRIYLHENGTPRTDNTTFIFEHSEISENNTDHDKFVNKINDYIYSIRVLIETSIKEALASIPIDYTDEIDFSAEFKKAVAPFVVAARMTRKEK